MLSMFTVLAPSGCRALLLFNKPCSEPVVLLAARYVSLHPAAFRFLLQIILAFHVAAGIPAYFLEHAHPQLSKHTEKVLDRVKWL